MFPVLLDAERYGDPKTLVERAGSAGIGIRPLFYPPHLQPSYSAYEAYRVEVAERLYEHGVCLPCSIGITSSDRDTVVDFLVRAAR